jgi:hypothetical protein
MTIYIERLGRSFPVPADCDALFVKDFGGRVIVQARSADGQYTDVAEWEVSCS